MPSKLAQLSQMTTVVADTGDLEMIKKWQPQDATTNPSLLLKALQQVTYRPLLKEAREWAAKQYEAEAAQLAGASDYLAVRIGKEILDVIPGRVSTEVDARLSFDTARTIEKARKLVDLYEAQDISRSRVLIKIASTWEGIRAAELLEKEGINCNLTLLFSFAQAVACAEAGVFLISPFVGRILDWYKQHEGRDSYPPEEDPGVVSVTNIYNYYKQHGYATVVMGASFRNVGEIEALAGCDRLTISPDLLSQLDADSGSLARKLTPTETQTPTADPLSESDFRWMMNEDAMATDKLSDGIRRFAADQIALEQLIKHA